MTTFYNIQNFLYRLSAINKKYEKLAEATGENFNIFRLLRLESSEVKLHSVFLSELLNPKASHGQGDKFLKLFIQRFKLKCENFITIDAQVNPERWTGLINHEDNTGGRIDILITDRNKREIIIENKIYAGDQDRQLLRYYNHNREADLFYLTLDGRDASEISKGELKEGVHYRAISYENDILKWLEECRKEAVTHPILRESITQYINLIRHLTNQSTNATMNEEITSLVSSTEENLKSAFTIIQSMGDVRERIAAKLVKDLNEITQVNGVTIIPDINLDLYKGLAGMFFQIEGWSHINISFQFQADNFDGLIYGLNRKTRDESKSDEEQALPVEIVDVIKAKLNIKDINRNWWWPHLQNYSPSNWQNNPEPWIDILTGKMKQSIEEKIKYYLEKFEGVQL